MHYTGAAATTDVSKRVRVRTRISLVPNVCRYYFWRFKLMCNHPWMARSHVDGGIDINRARANKPHRALNDMQAHQKCENSVLCAPMDLVTNYFRRKIYHFDVRHQVVVNSLVDLLVFAYSRHELGLCQVCGHAREIRRTLDFVLKVVFKHCRVVADALDEEHFNFWTLRHGLFKNLSASLVCRISGIKDANIASSTHQPQHELSKDSPGKLFASGSSVLVAGVKKFGILVATDRSPVSTNIEHPCSQTVPCEVVGEAMSNE
mmetsp:Transcript_36676/g.53773  ORF Transcript_36676/g.53773 Transcript_36676/m.53773 type:complete len:262 (-) Transcript_36676:340-1125(-)